MISNIRDLGGLSTKDGKTIKKGYLVRSANLSQAEEQDVSGISAIIDLRTPGERDEKPDCPCGRQYLALPIFEHITAGISHEQKAERKGPPDLSSLYRWLVRECRDNFKKVVSEIMEDYLKTNEVNIPRAETIREKVKESHGEEVAKGVYRAFIADEAYLEAAWSEMGDDYILQLGVTEQEIEEFRQKMLE